MGSHVTGPFLVLSCAMLLAAGGCAKNELVKKEEPVASASASKPATAETAKAESSGQQPIKQSPVRESTVHDQLESIPNAGELKAHMKNIYFDLDAFILSPSARSTLTGHVDIMKQDPDLAVLIEGHCDERGSDEYNLALGERRARAAMNYMVSMGVAEQRLSVISYGKEMPAAPGHDEASWAENRRDVFVVTTK